MTLCHVHSFRISSVRRRVSSKRCITTHFIAVNVNFVVAYVCVILAYSPSTFLTAVLCLVCETKSVFVSILRKISRRRCHVSCYKGSVAVHTTMSAVKFYLILGLASDLRLTVTTVVVAACPIVTCSIHYSSHLSDIGPRFSVGAVIDLLGYYLPTIVNVSLYSLIISFTHRCLNSTRKSSSLNVCTSVYAPVIVVRTYTGCICTPLLNMFTGSISRRGHPLFVGRLLKILTTLVKVFLVKTVTFSVFNSKFVNLVFNRQLIPCNCLVCTKLLYSSLATYITFLNSLLVTLESVHKGLVTGIVNYVISFPIDITVIGTFSVGKIDCSVDVDCIIALTIVTLEVTHSIQRVPNDSSRWENGHGK